MNTNPIEKIINILEVEVAPQLSYEDKLFVQQIISSLESIVFSVKAGLADNTNPSDKELVFDKTKTIYDILGENRI